MDNLYSWHDLSGISIVIGKTVGQKPSLICRFNITDIKIRGASAQNKAAPAIC